MTSSEADYPRPDFQRCELQWTSLDGTWDFLFDDNDIGLTERWHSTALPSIVQVDDKSSSNVDAEAEKIAQKTAAHPDRLIQDNVHTTSSVEENHKRDIIVPYVFQCPASGINERGVHEVMWYEREIRDPRQSSDKNTAVLLRFGAVDYEATVWLDGLYIGFHRGGHVPFDLDITSILNRNDISATYRLTVRVFDSAFDLTQPRGKQYWGAQPESIFYTPSGGIWQSVWLEVVPAFRLGDSSAGTLLKGNDIESGILDATICVLGRRAGRPGLVEISASFAGVQVATSARTELPRSTNEANIKLNLRLNDAQIASLHSEVTNSAPLDDDHCWKVGLALWSPEHPLLYDLTLRLYTPTGALLDSINTTIGMRSLNWSTGDGTWRLNGHPYFQVLALDQGYWPTTFMTPPSSSSLRQDIELAKAMGFNGCRKHQKVEDPRFLHYADQLGYLVWGEMANAYQFSLSYAERFDEEWSAAVKRDRNHACVVTWTPVNESWGYGDLVGDERQRDHVRSLYWRTRVLDSTRMIVDNDGWEHVVEGDVCTFHDYSDSNELGRTCATIGGVLDKKSGREMFVGGAGFRKGMPVICTEFGGVNIAAGGGDKGSKKDWGYTTATNAEDLLERVEKLVMSLLSGGHVCGLVWTQLTDIEQEVNGLYTPDRKEKLDAGKVKLVMEKAKEAYYESLQAGKQQ